MANVLFAANTLLTTKAARFGSRRVFLVTDDDSPGTNDQQKSAITRARDLNDLGIRLEPFFISHPGCPPFDISKFYENVIYRDDEDQDDGEYHLPMDAGARFETLLSLIKAKQTPRRSQFNIIMEIGPGMEIGVKGFIVVKRQDIQRSHYVYAQGEKLVTAQVESADIDPVRTTLKTSPSRYHWVFSGQGLIVGIESDSSEGSGPESVQVWRRSRPFHTRRTQTTTLLRRPNSTHNRLQTDLSPALLG